MRGLGDVNEKAATMAKKMKKPLRSPSERPFARNHLGPNTTTNHIDDGGRPFGYVDVLIVCVRPVLLSFQLVFKVEHLRSRCTKTQDVFAIPRARIFTGNSLHASPMMSLRGYMKSAASLSLGVSSLIGDSRC